MATYALCLGAWAPWDLPTRHHLYLSVLEETARILMEIVYSSK